jgi:hypothetical protein
MHGVSHVQFPTVEREFSRGGTDAPALTGALTAW